MSQNEIHGDSLLSSISNISVKIDHTEIDDPGFFNHNVQRSIDDHQLDAEVNIDVIQDDQDIDHASLVKQIYFRYKANQVGSELQDHVDPWLSKKDLHGLSEEENDSQFNQNIAKPQLIQCKVQVQKLSPNTPTSQQLKHYRLEQQKRLKNQTKNIPKNYGKAIITFVQKYQPKVRSICNKNNVSYEQFIDQLKQKKKIINTIADLRSMWLDYKYAKCMRVLSNLFLRKYALSYIFNSRICNYSSHIKYRYRLCDAIKEPFLFKHIKDY